MFKKISLLALALVIIILIVLFFRNNKQNEQNNNTNNNQLSALDMIKEQDGNENTESVVVRGAAEIPGANIVSTEQVVVTDMGEPVKANVMPNSPEAPKAVSIETKQLTEKMVQIKIENNKFIPDTFKVSAGAPVSLAFISDDKKTHVITFSDSSLAALAFGVSSGKIKAMSFNAPDKAGEYKFKCDVPGHSAQGYMIVE